MTFPTRLKMASSTVDNNRLITSFTAFLSLPYDLQLKIFSSSFEHYGSSSKPTANLFKSEHPHSLARLPTCSHPDQGVRLLFFPVFYVFSGAPYTHFGPSDYYRPLEGRPHIQPWPRLRSSGLTTGELKGASNHSKIATNDKINRLAAWG